MEIKKRVFVLAFLITLILLFFILLLGGILNNERKGILDEKMNFITDINEIQTYSLMSDIYGSKFACLAFKRKLQMWDKSLWDLGMKLEQYRVATEEFQKDAYYLQQKKKFNENELLYLFFLTKVKKECSLNQPIITSFYRNSEDCLKCDDQSFVLSDIKREGGDAVSIFSFDLDLNITSIKLLNDYYGVDKLPCIIIDEAKYCGIRSRGFIIKMLCEKNGNLSICP